MTFSPATASSPEPLGQPITGTAACLAAVADTKTQHGGGRILGIDPGPEETAIVLWDGARVLQAEIEPSRHVAHTIVALYMLAPLTVACEHLQCFGMSVGAEVFETAYWIGEYRRVCADKGIRFTRIFRSEEKMTLCHSMKATDSNIRQALIDQFGGKEKAIGKKKTPGPLYGIHGDMWSALAVAIVAQTKYP